MNLEAEILSSLNGSFEVFCKESTVSTMDDAKEYVHSGQSHKAVFVANEQTNGRGRRGTAWESQAGAVMMTCAIPMTEIRVSKNLVTLAAGIGVLKSVRYYSDLFFCKWPNDIVTADGRKIAGLLAETVVSDDVAEQWLNIGIGLNRTDSPHYASSLQSASRIAPEEMPTKSDLIATIARNIYESLTDFDDARIIEQANRYLYRPAEPQQFEYEGSAFPLVVKSIASSGALEAMIDGNVREFVTGHFVRVV